MLNKQLKHAGTIYAGKVGAKMGLPSQCKPKANPKKKPAKDALVASGGVLHGQTLIYSRGSGDAVTMPICVHGVCCQYMRSHESIQFPDGNTAYWIPNPLRV
jgi:hypothetical protein